MRVLLVACYELGHQPVQVAGPAGLLRARGHEVRCLDLAVEPWDDDAVAWADRIAISVPMHTATRIARAAVTRIEHARPEIAVACFGLYAHTVQDVADTALSGETAEALARWVEGDLSGHTVQLGREAAHAAPAAPARDLLPPLDRYAHLIVGDERRTAGAVEASRGCVHRCRHCPVPVVYDGRIRIVDADSVLRDVAQLVDAGARHVSFQDPDFFNGVHHSMRVVSQMHANHPELTFDCTVKVEHILRHRALWPSLAASGCLFVVSAFESVDDAVLDRLDKRHHGVDAALAVQVLRDQGIDVRPSWLPFTPWTTLGTFQALLEFVAVHDLVDSVDPVQYTVRLLLPRGSLLLDDPELAPFLGPYDDERATYTWRARDPAADELHEAVAALVEERTAAGDDPRAVYDAVRVIAGLTPVTAGSPPSARPRLSEPWFCCAEPTRRQLDVV